MDASWGVLHPASQGQMIHNIPLCTTQYARVQVDGIYETYHEYPLPIPLNEEITILYEAKGTFIQWPKEDIFVEAPEPTETPPAPHLTKIVTAPTDAHPTDIRSTDLCTTT
jgi:hypothetical protein